MAYETNDLFERAKDVIKKKKLFFIEDVVSLLPCTKATFYVHFPKDSDELNSLKEILEENRVEVKSSMRNKWYNSDNPTLQIGLYKLIGSEEEVHRLNGSKTQSDITVHTEQPLFPDVSENDSNQ